LIVAGVNKIVRNVDEAIDRARNIAATMNAKRLERKTPCIHTGKCTDCDSIERICRVTSIIHRRPHNTKITVILVGELLGY
jgi:hypothetical protein